MEIITNSIGPNLFWANQISPYLNGFLCIWNYPLFAIKYGLYYLVMLNKYTLHVVFEMCGFCGTPYYCCGMHCSSNRVHHKKGQR